MLFVWGALSSDALKKAVLFPGMSLWIDTCGWDYSFSSNQIGLMCDNHGRCWCFYGTVSGARNAW